jgi:MFS family permease
VTNVGAVAEPLADAYSVSLVTIGLFTTAAFLTHAGLQVPSGRLVDRAGARRVGLAGLVIVVFCNAVAMAAPHAPLALSMRFAGGIGTALVFVGGSDYVRAAGGGPLGQGLFGGVSLAAGGAALAVVPPVEAAVGWRAPFLTAAAVALAGLAILVAGPVDPPRGVRPSGRLAGVVRDRRLYPFAAMHVATLGLSIVIGNWIVALLHRNTGLSESAAGAVGAATLLLGVVTRPYGGVLLRTRPARANYLALVASMLAGGAGTLAILSGPLPLAATGCVVCGLAAGLPFAAAFTGAAAARPDAPGAAIGFVNGCAGIAVLALTPLVGLTFSLPGDGRIGFAALALLWASAALAVPRPRIG